MEITTNKLLRAFFHFTTVVMIIGLIWLAFDGDFDIYSVWIILAFAVGSYLIETRE